MIITKHGYKRIKERIGLPKRAHFRHIKHVMEKGSLFSYHKYEEFKMVYHGFLYIFKLTSHFEPILVTTMPVSKNGLVR